MQPPAAIRYITLQPPIARVAVHFLHIGQQDAPVDRVADEFDAARVFAETMPTVVVLLFGEAANRLAAELLEGSADMAHVEEQLLIGGDLRRRANAHSHRTVTETDAPESVLAEGAHFARRLVEQIDRAIVHGDEPQVGVDEAEALA